MILSRSRSWRIPERDATPEAIYLRRREILAGAGFVAASIASPSLLAAAVRNERYKLDRPVTVEWAATSYNNYYEFTIEKSKVKDTVGAFKPRPWTLEVSGLVNQPLKLSIEEIEKSMPIEERLYRHRCVEAWAMAVPWTGFALSHLLKKAEPKANAKWVRFTSVNRPDEMPGIRYSGSYEWPYREALRIDEAMNELAFMVTGIYGKSLPKQNGAPLRLAIPWKYGFKGPKAIVQIELLEKRPPTFWNSLLPSEYGFFSNVNPKRPHPRWSQAVEQLLPNMDRVATLPYNGYGEFVAHMYNGTEI